MKIAILISLYLLSGIGYAVLYQTLCRLTEMELQKRLTFIIVAWPAFLMVHGFLEALSTVSSLVAYCSRQISHDPKEQTERHKE